MDEQTAPAERVGAVLATFDADAVHRAAAALTARDLASLASVLGVPRRLLEGDAAAARVLQRRTRSLANSNRPEIALMLAAACNEDTITALGPRHEDPTRDDMIDVLDPIVERHGSRVVALMLAAYVDSVAPCATVFSDLLDSDERFALDALAPNESIDSDDGADEVDERPEASAGATPTQPDPQVGKKAAIEPDPRREARRRERKERERAAKERRAHQAEATEAARRRRKDSRRSSRDG